MKKIVFFLPVALLGFASMAVCAESGSRPLLDSLAYSVSVQGSATSGSHTPLWLNANKYGLSSLDRGNGYLRASLSRPLAADSARRWGVGYCVDLAGAVNYTSAFIVQQAYIEGRWLHGVLTLGSKQWPLELKNNELSSGSQTLGINARPVPQLRVALPCYWPVPFTKGWLSLKGHIAYGMTTDGNWQESFTGQRSKYTSNTFFHSKAGYLKIGKVGKPVSLELGLEMAAQFGGTTYKPGPGGAIVEIENKHDFASFVNAFIPGGAEVVETTYQNAEGNQLGSWVARLNFDYPSWNLGLYADHFFEDHSQMFWEYGRWKDGHIGIEISFPKNKWISSLVWEGLNTTDQTGPILYDGIGGSFNDLQMSGGDNYYTNMEYLGWQSYGSSLGHPFLMGPQYNTDGINEVKGCRIKAQHVGISGTPSDEWKWRMLVSYSRNWGSYKKPFDKVTKQFSSLIEATYSPNRLKGWSVTAAIAIDRGNYPGNSTGGMITLSKTGGFGL